MPATTADTTPTTGKVSDAERLAAVLQRLARSRAALRRELVPPPEPAANGPDGLGLTGPLRRWWRRLRRATQGSPLAVLAGEAVQGWWQHHPWRPTATLLARQARPVLRQHPVAAVAVAALAGAALVGCRPWRWRAVDAQLRPLPGRALHWLLAQLGSAPVQATLASLALMALRRDPAADPAPDTGAPPSATPASPAAHPADHDPAMPTRERTPR